MDNKPVDWEKEKRIKAEREKAEMQVLTENKSNLAYLDPKSFSVIKGFSRDPEAHRVMGEKLSNLSLAVISLGAILDAILTFVATNLHMGLADTIPWIIEGIIYALLIALPAFGAFVAVVEIIAYFIKTRRKMIVPIINAVLAMVIFFAYLKIRELIIGI